MRASPSSSQAIPPNRRQRSATADAVHRVERHAPEFHLCGCLDLFAQELDEPALLVREQEVLEGVGVALGLQQRSAAEPELKDRFRCHYLPNPLAQVACALPCCTPAGSLRPNQPARTEAAAAEQRAEQRAGPRALPSVPRPGGLWQSLRRSRSLPASPPTTTLREHAP